MKNYINENPTLKKFDAQIKGKKNSFKFSLKYK